MTCLLTPSLIPTTWMFTERVSHFPRTFIKFGFSANIRIPFASQTTRCEYSSRAVPAFLVLKKSTTAIIPVSLSLQADKTLFSPEPSRNILPVRLRSSLPPPPTSPSPASEFRDEEVVKTGLQPYAQ